MTAMRQSPARMPTWIRCSPRSSRAAAGNCRFRRFRHEHQFLAAEGGTEVVDIFDYTSPLGPLGRLADMLFLRQYMSRLLRQRNAYLKREAESAAPRG